MSLTISRLIIIGFALISVAFCLGYASGLIPYLSFSPNTFFVIADRSFGLVAELITLAGVLFVLAGILSRQSLPKKNHKEL